MSAEYERKVRERKLRSWIFYTGFILFLSASAAFLFFELRSIILPVLVGAILAYLFRPIKKWLHIPWLPHELSVLISVTIAALVVSGAVSRVRAMIPDEKQKLELKVRLKYKMNERYQEFLGDTDSPVATVAKHELQPLMTTLNEWLSLNPTDQELFMKYRHGYKGEAPISDRYFEYFKHNLKRNPAAFDPHLLQEKDKDSLHATNEPAHDKKSGLMEALSIWILTPLVFMFLIFDSGGIRVAFIEMVPNRYFEMALVMIDELDEAIGAYLRGTFLECMLVGATMAVGLVLLGFPVSVAIFIGLISGLANAIPFLGTVIGLVISLAYGLIAEDVVPLIPGLSSESLPLYVTIVVAIAHLLDNAIYAPVVLGGAVNLHPLVVILAIASGSILLGFWGMLLAIPTVVVVKTGIETLLKELKAYRII